MMKVKWVLMVNVYVIVKERGKNVVKKFYNMKENISLIKNGMKNEMMKKVV